jgi:hypothetical protein
MFHQKYIMIPSNWGFCFYPRLAAFASTRHWCCVRWVILNGPVSRAVMSSVSIHFEWIVIPCKDEWMFPVLLYTVGKSDRAAIHVWARLYAVRILCEGGSKQKSGI